MSASENHESATATAEQHGANSTVTAPGTVVVRYANLSGALVTISRRPARDARLHAYIAQCTGCLDDTDSHFSMNDTLPTARTWASKHAAECRALPQPEPQV